MPKEVSSQGQGEPRTRKRASSGTHERERPRTATIRDVAVLAGVSIGTVSKALNGREGVGARTRANVLKAAEQLGFHSNALARNLLTGRSFTVGLITNDSFGRFSIPVMLGAEDALQMGQIAVLLCDGRRDDTIREQHYVRTLLSRRVDGIIVTGRRVDPRPPVNTDSPIPIVYAMSESTNPEDASVLPDDEGAADLLSSIFLQLAGEGSGTSPDRLTSGRPVYAPPGASTALAAAGLAIIGDGPLHGQWSEEWGRQAAGIMLRQTPDVDAVFCGSDQIARGVAEYLREIGCTVPDDVAIVGFDNWTVMAEASRPTLTTIDMNLSEVGRTAANILLGAIDGNETHGTLFVPSRLVVRASTGAAEVSYKHQGPESPPTPARARAPRDRENR